MTNRRDFIKKGSVMVAGSMVLPTIACNSEKSTTEETVEEDVMEVKNRIGVQIYSVRNQLREDFLGTINKLAEIGYSTIENYSLGVDGIYHGKYSPAEMKKIIDDSGMEMISTHCGYFDASDAEAMLEHAKASGLTYLVVPSLPGDLTESADTYKAVAENFNKVGEVFKGSGVQFGYHNHAFEFEMRGEELAYDILLKNTDPELVTFQADLYWVTRGGQDPMELLKANPGRFSSFHVKDSNEDLEQTTVGTGIIDFKSLISARDVSGMKDYFVEDEREDDPIGNLTAAFNYLNGKDWA